MSRVWASAPMGIMRPFHRERSNCESCGGYPDRLAVLVCGSRAQGADSRWHQQWMWALTRRSSLRMGTGSRALVPVGPLPGSRMPTSQNLGLFLGVYV